MNRTVESLKTDTMTKDKPENTQTSLKMMTTEKPLAGGGRLQVDDKPIMIHDYDQRNVEDLGAT
jgi:hypothetical protein